MNRQNHLRSVSNCIRQSINVHVESWRFDVYKNRLCTKPNNRADGREETERRCYHLIARTDSASHQGKQERIRARRATDCIRTATVLTHLALKVANFGTKD